MMWYCTESRQGEKMVEQTAYPPSIPRECRQGFSLLEVLVALAVAATAATAIMGLLQQNVTMAGTAWETMAHLNMAETLMLSHAPSTRNLDAVPWRAWPEMEEAKWRLTRERREAMVFRRGFEDGPAQPQDNAAGTSRLFLQTSIRGYFMTWSWLEPPQTVARRQRAIPDAYALPPDTSPAPSEGGGPMTPPGAFDPPPGTPPSPPSGPAPDAYGVSS